MAHNNERLIKCPYCDHEWEDSWEFDGEDGEEATHTCGSCEKEFNVVRNIEVTYSTTKIDCKIHDYQLKRRYVMKEKYEDRKWIDLQEPVYREFYECSQCDSVDIRSITKEEFETKAKE